LALRFFLVRGVSAGIKSIVVPMQALGNGDLTAQVPHQGEKTEIGAMAEPCRCSSSADCEESRR